MNDLSTTQLIGLAIAGVVAYMGRDYLKPLLAKLKGLWTAVPSPKLGGDLTTGVSRKQALDGAVDVIDFLQSKNQTLAAKCMAEHLAYIAMPDVNHDPEVKAP